MRVHVPSASCDSRQGVLERCVESFPSCLSKLGYSALVVRQKRSKAARFACWVRRRRLDVVKLDEAAVDAFLLHLRRHRVPIGNWRRTLTSFLDHLRVEAVVPRPQPVRDDSHAALLLQRYETYLREQRGLTKETARNYRQRVRAFVHKHLAVTAKCGFGYQEVRDYLLTSVHSLAPTTAQEMATALRSLLRFLFHQGETPTDLSATIPRARRWRRAKVHPYLHPQEVEQLLAACDRSTANGRRDHAILLLLARLGMRACEVSALEISDLRWRSGEIVVHGKGGIHHCLPMLPDVGAAVAMYLRDVRPKSLSSKVFLRNDAPRVGLGADAVGLVVRRALDRAGLHPPRRGSHLLRFSLATTMIRNGASMTEIGEVLRHRSPETTEIYAKVDFETLRAVALPWPGQGGAL
jgi:integrase/recombinase XerD